MAIKILSDCDETLKSERETCDRYARILVEIIIGCSPDEVKPANQADKVALDKLSALFYDARAEARKEGRNNGR